MCICKSIPFYLHIFCTVFISMCRLYWQHEALHVWGWEVQVHSLSISWISFLAMKKKPSLFHSGGFYSLRWCIYNQELSSDFNAPQSFHHSINQWLRAIWASPVVDVFTYTLTVQNKILLPANLAISLFQSKWLLFAVLALAHLLINVALALVCYQNILYPPKIIKNSFCAWNRNAKSLYCLFALWQWGLHDTLSKDCHF